MKYEIVKFSLNIDNGRLSFINIYDGQYESRTDAETALEYIIDNEFEEEEEFDGRVSLYEITNLPSKLKEPTIEDECYWYASAYLCEGVVAFVREYSTNHDIPIQFI